MTILRFLSLALVAVWIGGLVTLGLVAAPGIFTAVEAHDPVNGAVLAGAVFGQIFETFTRLSMALGVALALALVARAGLGGRLRAAIARVSVVGVMVAAALATDRIIAARIDAIRAATAGPIANLPLSDPARVAFDRLHAASGVLMLVTIALGAWLLWMEAVDTRAGATSSASRPRS